VPDGDHRADTVRVGGPQLMTTVNTSLLIVGRVFTADPEAPWAEAILTDGERISFVGTQQEARALAPPDVHVVVADGVVLPGFVDGHAHLQMSGAALLQAPLRGCVSLDEIGDALLEWRAQNPHATRVLGLGWMFSAVPDATPTRHISVHPTCTRCGRTPPVSTN
jgi:predicted amidohydrolase YtcJ